jgi:filamentous hemagglutinin family protein
MIVTSGHGHLAILAALFLAGSVGLAAGQQALPKDGTTISGAAIIGPPSGNAMIINQISQKAVIDWGSFSIGAGNTVSINQPTSSAALLNRVTGSTPSTIAGQLTANGQVYLINPNGIAITPTGIVMVGEGFVASTLGLSNSDFNNGANVFRGTGASANVSNAGAISTKLGGIVALLGGTVENSGTISAPFGRVGIGSGEYMTLDFNGDGFLQVAVPTAPNTQNQALVSVPGKISAPGGRIEIKAATAQQVQRDAVNISGSLVARSVSGRSGNIVLEGGAGGSVIVSGKLSVKGLQNNKGGSIAITGRDVMLRGAIVDASGNAGGGTIRIGGDPRGVGMLPRSSITTVDQRTVINADAIVSGDGGQVTVWSDNLTSFGGTITAHGGYLNGNGGQVEVSGRQTLNLTGDYTKTPLANLTARSGQVGTLLFDPGTINIIDQSTLAGNTALNGPDTFTAQFISTQLGSANVVIDTNNATGANGAAGDINLLFGASIVWSSGNSLTLNAARSINFAAGASIFGTGAGAALTLRADTAGNGMGTVNFAGSTQVSVPSGGVDIYYNPASNRTSLNGGSNPLAGTVNSSSYLGTPAAETWSSFVNAPVIRPWMLVNSVYDLQNINNNLSAGYALGKDIDASAASGWNFGAGFVPLGTNGSGGIINGGFSGTLNGMGHTIANLTIDRGLASHVGLFGYVNGGTINDVGVVNASVTGSDNVGILVGTNNAGTINRSFATGTFSMSSLLAGTAGGLVGTNMVGGTINNSYSQADFFALLNLFGTAGGLVGINDGNINNSYAASTFFSLLTTTGALVGSNSASGNISQSYYDSSLNWLMGAVGWGPSSGATGLSTATFQNGSLPAGLSSTFWTAQSGQYPQLNWQIAATPPATTTVVVTATDSASGAPVYGDGAPSLSYRVTDNNGVVLCSSDCSAYFSGTPLVDTAFTSTTAAGTFAPAYIAQGTLAAQPGYSFQFANDPMVVAQRPLSITAQDQSKIYGTAASLGTSAFTANGLVNGDTVASVNLTSPGTISTASVAGAPYAISASGATGTGLSNYSISYATGFLIVNPAGVNITALGGSSTYGSSPANPGLSATGLQNGETVSVLTGFSNSFGITNTTGAGSYTLSVAGTLTNPNYTLLGTATGTWTVLPLRGPLTDGQSPSGPGQLITVPPSGNNDLILIVNTNSSNQPSSDGNLSRGDSPPLPSSAGAPGSLDPRDALPVASGTSLGNETLSLPTQTPAAQSTTEETPVLGLPTKCPEGTYAQAEPGLPVPSAVSGSGGVSVSCIPIKPTPAAHQDRAAAIFINPASFYRAMDRALTELKNSTQPSIPTVAKVAAVATVSISAGLVAWLLRGGALLSALLSSLPIWRGFDPLVVVLRPRRKSKESPAMTREEQMFENARGLVYHSARA